jgi:hypothetical protein
MDEKLLQELAEILAEIEPLTTAALAGSGVVLGNMIRVARKKCADKKGTPEWSSCVNRAMTGLKQKKQKKSVKEEVEVDIQKELKEELDNIFGEAEGNDELASLLAEIDPGTAAMAAGGIVAGGATVASRMMARSRCKKKFPDMKSTGFKQCFKNELTLGQKKKFRDQDESNAVLESALSEIDPATAAMAAGGVVAGGATIAARMMARRRCRQKFPDMKSGQFKNCFKNELTLGQKKKFRDHDEVLKTYAIFYVAENDEFDAKKKLDMLTFIESADASMIEDLYENGEIKAPSDYISSDDELATKVFEEGLALMEKGLLNEESASVTAGKEMVKTAKDYWATKAGQAGEKLHQAAQHMPGGVAGLQAVPAAVAAAAAITAGVLAYRKYFSKAAKACKGAPDKSDCMAKFKEKAKAAKVQAMSAGKAKCAKSKDPAACKAKIDAKIKAARG